MKPLRYKILITNLLISCGAYYLSRWAVFPLSFVFSKVTNGIMYRGDFAGYVVMPLVEKAPVALVAAIAGVSIVWLVESDQPIVWPIIPALLYAVLGLLGRHWMRPPLLLDRLDQVIGAFFPAITCIVGGILASRRRATPLNPQTNLN